MTVLKNVLNFTGLVIGTPVSQAHGININGLAQVPKIALVTSAGYTVTADSTNITVTRGASAAANVNVYVEAWHSYEDSEPLPGGIATSVFPIIMQGGAVAAGAGGVALSALGSSNSTGTVTFSNSNGVSFGMAGNVVTASVAGGGLVLSAGSAAVTSGTAIFSNSNGISFGANGNTITASFNGALAGQYSAVEFNRPAASFNILDGILTVNRIAISAPISATQVAFMFDLPNGPQSATFGLGIYTMNGSTASLVSNATSQLSYSASNQSDFTGARWRTIGANFSLTAGEYMLGVFQHVSSTFAQTAYGVVRVFPPIGTPPNGFNDGVLTSGAAFLSAPGSINLSQVLQTGLNSVNLGTNVLVPSVRFAGTF